MLLDHDRGLYGGHGDFVSGAEEVVMAVRTRQDYFPCDTKIDATHIVSASKLVSGITGFPVQPNKAIVGSNAFSHSSGIHQDGFLKEATTYEIIAPEEVGADTSKIVLTARSGRSALAYRFKNLGYSFDRNQVDELYERFLTLADSKKEVEDADLKTLAEQIAITA